MYAQLVETGLSKVQARADMTPEEAAFQARIDADVKVEAKDWMPDAYRKTLTGRSSSTRIRKSSGCCRKATGSRGPRRSRKAILMAKVQDEGGHGLYLYTAAETLGVSRDQLIADLRAGKVEYSSIFNYPTLTWADIGAIGWLVDGAAIMNQIPLCRCSYGPMRGRWCASARKNRSPAAGLRHHDVAVPRTPARGDGAGRAQPLVVAVAHDVQAAGWRVWCTARNRRSGRSSPVQRRVAPALRRPDGAAGRLPRHHDARSGSRLDAQRELRFRRDRLERVPQCSRATALQPRAPRRTRESWEDGAWVRAAVAHAEARAAQQEASVW